MENGSWIIFGPLAWLYAIAGFIIGIIKTPYLWVKESQKYYKKGLEIEKKRKNR